MLHVRILRLVTQTMEADVDSMMLLEARQPFDYAQVRELAELKPPEAPA